MSGKAWPEESAEELLAKLEAEHGPEVARIAYKAITGELPATTKWQRGQAYNAKSGHSATTGKAGKHEAPHTGGHRR